MATPMSLSAVNKTQPGPKLAYHVNVRLLYLIYFNIKATSTCRSYYIAISQFQAILIAKMILLQSLCQVERDN